MPGEYTSTVLRYMHLNTEEGYHLLALSTIAQNKYLKGLIKSYTDWCGERASGKGLGLEGPADGRLEHDHQRAPREPIAPA